MNKRVCVIGAGPSGIAAGKNCVAEGLDVVLFERNNKVGGNWVFNASTGHSSVYNNTHIISSKAWSEYEDFPMPDGAPEYPGHAQLQAYFEAYARHFGVYERIRFRHEVRHVSRLDSGQWQVDFTDGQGQEHTEQFDTLMVSNGHHWHPKYPEYPGSYTGKLMHSHDFKGISDEWAGKRVLVIGGGNSACDVAVEAARVASPVSMSMRSAQWFVPKFVFGKPVDVFASGVSWQPKWLKKLGMRLLLNVLQGPYARYGLKQPEHSPLSAHPTLNSDLLDFIRHGRIKPMPGIKRWDGLTVEFTDGTRGDFDVVCACTGFWTVLPFFDKDFIDFQHLEKVPLYRKMMHEQYHNLYFIGLFQPLGCIWPLADYQAKLACQEILGRYKRPSDLNAAIQHEMDHPHFDFLGGQRHAVEVDYHGLRNELKADLKTAGIDIGTPPMGIKGRYKSWVPAL